MAGDYQEYAPTSRLAGHVACCWTVDVSKGGGKPHAVLPDGCIDLLFERCSGTVQVVGTMTRALWTPDCGAAQFFGVRFRPGGVVSMLADRADLLTDRVVDAETILGASTSEIQDRVMGASSIEEGWAILEEYLAARLLDHAAVDRRIEWSCARLSQDPGAPVESISDELGMSRQYLRRLFLEHTGLAPKAFARIGRLRKLVPLLRSATSLSDAALAAGYSDQAHMTREFRALVGTTPSAYRAGG